jgi:hypothetical protein
MDPLRIEAVDRLVEHDGLRVAEQRGGNAEPLPHSERERSRALLGHVVQPDHVDQLVHAAPGNAVRLREREQMVVRRAARVHGARLEQRADLVQRRLVIPVALPVHRDGAGRWRVEAEDQAHGRRLPGAVRAEEAGDDAGLDDEAELVDGPLLSVVLREAVSLDHVMSSVGVAPLKLQSMKIG